MLKQPGFGKAQCRSGVTVVETALVISLFLVFLFAIFEFGRYLMVLQTMENAAREGARYACVHTYDPTVESDAIDVVREMMAEVDLSAFGGPAAVEVYAADRSGTDLGDPRNAQFGQYIGVRITGTYQPIMPGLVLVSEGGLIPILPNSIPVEARALMNSEAN